MGKSIQLRLHKTTTHPGKVHTDVASHFHHPLTFKPPTSSAAAYTAEREGDPGSLPLLVTEVKRKSTCCIVPEFELPPPFTSRAPVLVATPSAGSLLPSGPRFIGVADDPELSPLESPPALVGRAFSVPSPDSPRP